MSSDCNGVSYFQKTWWKKLIFVSAKPSPTILSIDRSGPRFESSTRGKITKTLKNNGKFDGFC